MSSSYHSPHRHHIHQYNLLHRPGHSGCRSGRPVVRCSWPDWPTSPGCRGRPPAWEGPRAASYKPHREQQLSLCLECNFYHWREEDWKYTNHTNNGCNVRCNDFKYISGNVSISYFDLVSIVLSMETLPHLCFQWLNNKTSTRSSWHTRWDSLPTSLDISPVPSCPPCSLPSARLCGSGGEIWSCS